MKTLIWEHANSQPETRFIPLCHAQILGQRGGFHRVQIIDINDEIVYEYKADREPKKMTLADWRMKQIGAYWYAINNFDGTEYIAPSKAELMRKINRH